MEITTEEISCAKKLFMKHFNYDSYARGFINEWISLGFKKSRLLRVIKFLGSIGIVNEGTIMYNTRRINTYCLQSELDRVNNK